MESEPAEIGGKPRLRTSDAKIGDERQAEPAADRRTLHGGDDRLLVAKQPGALLVKMLGLAVAGLARRTGIRAFRKIRAGAERLAFGREHDRPALRIRIERIEDVGDRVDQRVVEKIVRRAPDLDRGHVVRQTNGDVLRCRSVHRRGDRRERLLLVVCQAVQVLVEQVDASAGTGAGPAAAAVGAVYNE